MTKQQCIHAELARADERSPWYCVNPDCGFTLWPPDEPTAKHQPSVFEQENLPAADWDMLTREELIESCKELSGEVDRLRSIESGAPIGGEAGDRAGPRVSPQHCPTCSCVDTSDPAGMERLIQALGLPEQSEAKPLPQTNPEGFEVMKPGQCGFCGNYHSGDC